MAETKTEQETWASERRDELAKSLREQYYNTVDETTREMSWAYWQARAEDLLNAVEEPA